MLFIPPGGPPREFWLWGVGVGTGRKWRGNGQLQLNVRLAGPAVSLGRVLAVRAHLQRCTCSCTLAAAARSQRQQERSPDGPVGGAGRAGGVIHGNAAALLLWLLLHWANSPNCSLPAGLFSPPAHCLYALISFRAQEGGDRCESHWANSGERRLPSLPCSQENLPFYFFIWAPSCRAEPSLMSESWIKSFKPKGAGHPSPNTPCNVLLEIIRALPLHTTNTGPSKAPSSASTPLFIVLKPPGKNGCLTWYHSPLWWIMSGWVCSLLRGSDTWETQQDQHTKSSKNPSEGV